MVLSDPSNWQPLLCGQSLLAERLSGFVTLQAVNEGFLIELVDHI
jgi:hypothetical protein